jgi:hypothetical protein
MAAKHLVAALAAGQINAGNLQRLLSSLNRFDSEEAFRRLLKQVSYPFVNDHLQTHHLIHQYGVVQYFLGQALV